jgi:uncharacterized membrane protein
MASASEEIRAVPPQERPSDPKQLPRAAQSAHALNALVHLYRAEVGRLTAYRQRLDTTTSWAISSTALVGTIAFGSAAVPHAAFVFLMFLTYFFLHLEARRFRYYEISRDRVQILERYFYPEILGYKFQRDPQWEELLINSLRKIRERPGRVAAIGWRLRRTYYGIYVAIFVAWLLRLHLESGATWSFTDLVGRASIGAVSGSVVFLAVATLYLLLTLCTAMAPRLYPEGDDWYAERPTP